jgi:hypothetical protein
VACVATIMCTRKLSRRSSWLIVLGLTTWRPSSITLLEEYPIARHQWFSLATAANVRNAFNSRMARGNCLLTSIIPSRWPKSDGRLDVCPTRHDKVGGTIYTRQRGGRKLYTCRTMDARAYPKRELRPRCRARLPGYNKNTRCEEEFGDP